MHKVAKKQYDSIVYDEQQRLQMMQIGGPGAQQIGMSGSSNGGRSHGAVMANGPMSPQNHGQQQYDRRLWE